MSSTYTINKYIQNTASFLNGNAVSDKIISTTITGSLTGSVTGSLFGTAAYATTAAYALNGGGGTTLTTGETYHITSSWAETSSLAKTSSISNYALNFPFPRVVAAVSFVSSNNTTGTSQYLSSSYNVKTVVKGTTGQYIVNFINEIPFPYYVIGTTGGETGKYTSFNVTAKVPASVTTYIGSGSGKEPKDGVEIVDVMIFKNNVDYTIINDTLNREIIFETNLQTNSNAAINYIKTQIDGIPALQESTYSNLKTALKTIISNLANNTPTNRFKNFTSYQYSVNYDIINSSATTGNATYTVSDGTPTANGTIYYLFDTSASEYEITFSVILTNI